MSKKILVGVLCYNSADTFLAGCLEAIRARSGDETIYNLVVLDDSGKKDHQDKSKAIADKYNAKWLVHDVNKGITAGWNDLVQSGEEPLVALLNDDIIVAKDWLTSLIYFLENNPQAGAVGIGFYFISQEDVPVLLTSPDMKVKARHYATKQHLKPDEDPNLGMDYKSIGRPGYMMCPVGCSFGFTREKYNLVGGFDPAMRNFYNESEFSTALTAKGFRSYMVSYPVIYHIWSATFQTAPELLVNSPMDKDRQAYIAKFGGDFAYTDPLYMSQLKPVLTKWWTPDVLKEEIY